MTGPTIQIVQSNGHRFEIIRWSSDIPEALLLPGATGGIRGYGALGAELQSLGLGVAGMNPRGCGGSQASLENVTLRDLAGDVIEVLSVLCDAPALLIGHAGGNRVARMAASMRPDLITAVVLLAAGGMVPPDEEAQAALSQIMSGSVEKAERHKLYRTALFAPDSKIPDEYFEVPDRSAEFGRAFSAALAATPVGDWWAGGSCPILAIQGLQDRIAPPPTVIFLKPSSPTAFR
ncbi:alpha/beta fold hydrolase [Sulfitobacter aestuariivivens]|uniref:alpha/beta fold hydrolase n=1 Tax=Sulfitobacter aestuariivivens TaxID=2766981 RepID=UPI00361CAD81